MKKNNRKGFTITELVIVIAVIAILAAVLIPTFAGIINRAEKSTITQETRAAVTVLLGEKNGSIPAGTYIIYFDGDEELWFEYDTNAGKLGEQMDSTAVTTAKGYADADDEFYARTAAASKVLTTAQTKALEDLSTNIEIFINK